MELGRGIPFRDNAITATAATTLAIDAIACITFPLAVLAFALGSRLPATASSSAIRACVDLPKPP